METRGHFDPALPTNHLLLCYHALSLDWEADLSLAPDRFERQIQSLLQRGYTPVTFSEVVESGDSSARLVAITFDDAFKSVFDLGKPILDRLGAKASVFVPTKYVNEVSPLAWKGTDHWASSDRSAELTPMSWDLLRELAETGWEIGSHTHTHPRLTEVDELALERELVESRQTVAREIGTDRVSLAYPYGSNNETVRRAAAAAGYTCAAALHSRGGQDTRYNVNRIGVYATDSDQIFKVKTSRPGRWVMASAAWNALGPLVRRGKRLITH